MGEQRFTLYEHRRKYYVRFSVGGRQFKKPVADQAGMQRAQAEGKAGEIVAHAHRQLERARRERETHHPIAQYERRIRDKSLSHVENCNRFRERLIARFGQDCDMLAITRRDVEEWRDWLLNEVARQDRKGARGVRGLSWKTVSEHLDWLSAVYKHAGLPNPCAGVERPRKNHAQRVEALEFFTPDEMRRLLEVCAQLHPAWINGFTALCYTGCRISEIQRLRPEDLDRDNRIAYVTGKGGKRRPLKLTGPIAPAWDAIIAEIEARPRPDGYVFPQYESWGQKMLERICLNAFGATDAEGKEITDASKLKRGKPNRPGHPHMLRHTLASMALLHFRPTWDIAFLAKWLGHKDIGLTYQTYGHWIAVEPPSGYAALDPRTSLEPKKKPARKAG